MIAPVEYMIVGFDGNHFNGKIVPAIVDLAEAGLIKVLDIVFILKDGNGDVTAIEFDDLEELEPFQDLTGGHPGLLSEEDLFLAAEVLEPNTSAAFFVWEDLWAANFAKAILESGGTMLKGERIPHQVVVEALEFDAQRTDG